ncbi:MAG: NirD/YgiW/YdeI family stress tolerance protein [Pseudomonadota bacterium]
MITRRIFLAGFAATAGASAAVAQFTGPSVQGAQSTVSAAQSARVGSYITLEGSIVSHLREDYYTFRDGTGEMRVEISQGRFGGRAVGPSDRVRIMGEIDNGRAGRYIWVKSLQVL